MNRNRSSLNHVDYRKVSFIINTFNSWHIRNRHQYRIISYKVLYCYSSDCFFIRYSSELRFTSISLRSSECMIAISFSIKFKFRKFNQPTLQVLAVYDCLNKTLTSFLKATEIIFISMLKLNIYYLKNKK